MTGCLSLRAILILRYELFEEKTLFGISFIHLGLTFRIHSHNPICLLGIIQCFVVAVVIFVVVVVSSYCFVVFIYLFVFNKINIIC